MQRLSWDSWTTMSPSDERMRIGLMSACCDSGREWLRISKRCEEDNWHFAAKGWIGIIKDWLFIMAALRSRCGHSILQLWILLFLLLSFFLAYSHKSQIGCLPYFYTWCGLSAYLECRSEMCCTQLAGNTGDKNDAKNCHLDTIAQLCPAVSSQLSSSSSSRDEYYLGGTIALLLQDHRAMSTTGSL